MINVGDLLAVLRLQDQLSPTVEIAYASLSKLDSAMTITTQQARTLGAYLGLTSEQMKKLDVNTQMSAAQLKDLTGALHTTNYQWTLLGRGMSEVGMIMSGVSLGLSSMIKTVIDVGSEFETQMTRVVTLAGATREQVTEMTPEIKRLAEETGVSSTEMAKGMYVLLSTGRTTAEALDTLAVSAKMSALGMGNMHDTTLALTGAMFAYKESNLSASDAANTLIKAVQLGNMEIQDLVPAIARVNPIASALGVSFQDVAAGMATFTHAGVNSAVAATGMRAMLNNILRDSVKTEKGFAQLARALKDPTISMENFRKEMRSTEEGGVGFTQAMVNLTDKAKSVEGGMEALADIFPNIRALTEALFVYKINGDMVNMMMTDMKNKVNELDKGMGELKETWAQKWKEIKTAIENVWIKLSMDLLPIFEKLFVILKGGIIILDSFATAFNQLPAAFQYSILLIGALVTAIGPFLVIAGQLTMAYGNIMRGLSEWGIGANTLSIKANTEALLENSRALTGNAIAIEGQAVATGTKLTGSFTRLGTSITGVMTKLRAIPMLMGGITAAAAGLAIGAALAFQAELADQAIARLERIMRRLQNEGTQEGRSLNDAENLIDPKERQQQLDLIETTKELRILQESGERLDSSVEGLNADFHLLNLKLDPTKIKLREAEAAQRQLYRSTQLTADSIAKLGSVIGQVPEFKPGMSLGPKSSEAAKEVLTSYQLLKREYDAIIQEVRNLTAEQRRELDLRLEMGEQIPTIVKEMKLSSDQVVEFYKKEEKAADKAGKAADKAAMEQKTALEQVDGFLAEYGGRVGKTTEEWVRLDLAAGDTLSNIEKASGLPIATLKKWRDEIKETAAAQEKAGKDIVTHYNQVAVLADDTAAREAKAAGETYESQRINTDKWMTKSLQALNTLDLGHMDYYIHLMALAKNYNARIAEIDAKQLADKLEILERLQLENEKWIADNLALWSNYLSEILDADKAAGESRIAGIRANAIRLEAENQKHLGRVLLQIVRNNALSENEKIKEAQAEIRLAEETSRAIEAIRDAKIYEERLNAIVDFVSQFSTKLAKLAETIGKAWKIITNDEIAWNPQTQAYEKVVSTTQKWVAGLSAASSVIDTLVTGADRASSAIRGAVSGAATGASIGAMFTPIGAGIGAAVGAVAGLINGWVSAGKSANESNAAANKELVKLRENILKTYGSLRDLSVMSDSLGVGLAKAWGETGVKGLEKFAKLMDEFEAKMKTLQSSLDKYKLSWFDLGKDMRQVFTTQYGNDLLNDFKVMTGAGVEADLAIRQMSSAISQYIVDAVRAGTTIPPAFYPIVRRLIEMGELSDEAAKALLGIVDIGMPALADIKAAADRYGLSLDQLGPKVQQLSLNETASQIVKDFKTFEAAGADLNSVLSFIPEAYKEAQRQVDILKEKGYDAAVEGSSQWSEYQAALKAADDAALGMGQQVQKLVTTALKSGLELPSSLRPIIQTMIDMGELTDDNGEKLTDLSQLNFAADLEDMFIQLITKLDELLQVIVGPGGVSESLEGLGDITINPIRVPYYFDPENQMYAGPLPKVQYGPENPTYIDPNSVLPVSLQAAGGDYLVSKPTLFVAGDAGPERATFSPIGKPTSNGGSAVTIVVQAWDGPSVDAWLRRGGSQKIADAVVPKIPGVVRKYGLV